MAEQNVDRFTGRVEDYARYRAHYPSDLMAVLEAECGLTSASLIADVGAGTGMLAELFLKNGNGVTAVEPNVEMRAACEKLIDHYPELTVIDGVAEATGLGSGSVDFVTVGRAFHWFDRERALTEFRRILRADGWVVLASMGRPEGGGQRAQAFERILMEHGVDYAARWKGFRLYDTMDPLSRGSVVRRRIEGEREETWDQLLGEVRSLSPMPKVGDSGYEEMVLGLREFFERYSVGGVVRMETVCSMMACRIS